VCVCVFVKVFCVRRVLVLLLKENSLWVCSFLCVCECVYKF
jgi:hypothetical protein